MAPPPVKANAAAGLLQLAHSDTPCLSPGLLLAGAWMVSPARARPTPVGGRRLSKHRGGSSASRTPRLSTRAPVCSGGVADDDELLTAHPVPGGDSVHPRR